MSKITNNNAFFKTTDPKIEALVGIPLNPSWWSRMYEYAWAIQFAAPGQNVADMGAGWSGRPFKEALADVCKDGNVYAVDQDERFLELPNNRDNLYFLVGNFEQELPFFEAGMMDRVFCISVLEDLTNYSAALREFYRVLKPGGLLVITCDSQYDENKPLTKYPGVSFRKLFDAIEEAGFQLPNSMDLDVRDAVFHEEWNLACWHMVLTK